MCLIHRRPRVLHISSGPCHREVSMILTIYAITSIDILPQPSTWEAMFRAELGSGNRDNAVALLERLQAR